MPRPGGSLSTRSAAEAYGVLRCLSLQEGIVGRALADAREALLSRGLEESERPSREQDERLLQDCRENGDAGAFLCLRCRVSWPLEQRLRSLHQQFGKNYGLELLELAAFALDDTGRRLPYWQESPAQLHHPEPFGVTVIRSYQSDLSGLGHWARQKLLGLSPLKSYLKQQGVRLIRDWALLADSSSRLVVEAVTRLDGRIPPQTAEQLHQRYVPLYRQAKLQHLRSTGRQQGWEPDEAFLRTLMPQQPSRDTKELLERIARAVRRLESGGWQKREADLLDAEALERWAEAAGEDAWWEASEPDGLEALNVARLVEEVGRQTMEQMLRDLSPTGVERQIWQAWAEGLRQRQIAERCGTNQARISRTVKEESRAAEIATRALERLHQSLAQQPQASWAALFRSPGRLQEAERRLMNHLLQPEQEGGVSPLRRWVQQALHSWNATEDGDSAPASGYGSGDGR